MAKNKLNGWAKWVAIVLAILTMFYNAVATHVIAKNEIAHLRRDVNRLEQKVEWVCEYLIDQKQ